MRNVYTIVFFFMLSFTAMAQISFTTADFHSRLNNSQLTVFNNNYPVYPNVATGSASASSQTWNFGTLPSGFITDSSKQNMMPANKIPRSSYFPTANYGSYDSSFSGGTSLAISLFYQVADDGLYLVGMVQRYILAPNIDTILVSTIKPKQLTLPIPLALGVYRTYRDTMDSPGKREIRTDEFLVNGFGTMTFPNGVTTSVLRVRHKETRLTYKNNVLTATDWGTMIDYWAKDFTCLSLDMNDSSFTTGSGQVKNIDFSKWGALTDARDGNPALANAIVLDQNFPNPFNPVTTISFALKKTSAVSISVHNALGEPVAMLLNGEKGAGAHSVVWNAVGMPSGVYFYEIRTPEYREVKKLMLMK